MSEENRSPPPQEPIRPDSPRYKGKFPIERFPSPPSDGYVHYVDDDDEAGEGREEAISSDVFYPPLLEIVYPPKAPLDIKDPTWLATMLYDVQRQRKHLTHRLEDARAEATAALLEATLAQSELDEEARKMQAFLNLIARVAGNSYVGRLIRSAEYAVNHTRNGGGDDDSGSGSQSEGDDNEDDGDAGGNEGGQVSDGASDRSHDSTESDRGSRSRSNSVSSGYKGNMPSSHDLHAYISQSPHKFERLPSPESVDEQDSSAPAAEIQFPPSAIPDNYSVNRKRSRDDLEDMYATPGSSTAAHPRASKRLQKQKAVDVPLALPSDSRKRPLEVDDDNESLAPSESASQRGWKGKGKAVDNGRQNKRPRLEDEEGHEESSSSALAQSAGWFKWLTASVSTSKRASTPVPDAGDEPSEEIESIGSHAESEPELQYPFSSEELALERLSAASKVPYSDLHDDLSMVPALPQTSLSLEVQPVDALALAVPSDVVPYTGPSSASDVVVLSSREARVRSLRPRPEVKADAGKKVLQIDRRRGAPLRRDPWRIREKDGEIELHHVDSDF